MSVSQRVHGVKVLKAVSSSLRLQLLNLLFERGSLSYTDLMNALKMSPSRDAGRFAYHLKFLLKADLIESDAETKKYSLTDLGKMVLDVADRLEKRASKREEMVVRASRLALEEFDANKIAYSLIREAAMPVELAQKIAKEAEKLLLKSKIRYITAPLVREVVNALLVEKGLEEYRHKLTRLGLPVHEVHMLLNAKSRAPEGAVSVYKAAGDAVLNEYVLLNVFPRDVGDAHMSGAIHISDMSAWLLKPKEIVHDLRVFLQNGISLSRFLQAKPKNFESAISMTLNMLLSSSRESEEQTLPYFNVFLAPYIRNSETRQIKEFLRTFIVTAAHHANFSIGLECKIPDFIGDQNAAGPLGTAENKYSSFHEEAWQLASLVLDVVAEESTSQPLLNPKIIMNVRPECFDDKKSEELLLKAHQLALEKSSVYFAYIPKRDCEQRVFSGLGAKFSTDFSGDWEIDTLRTCCLGMASVNLPRVAYENERDSAKFFGALKDRLEMVVRALDIKFASMKQNSKALLPFLSQSINGDDYFRVENSLCLVNLVGVKEAVEATFGKNIGQNDKALEFVDEILRTISSFLDKTGRKRNRRLLPSLLFDGKAAERLATLDADRYGFGRIKFSGSRNQPYYSSLFKLAIKDDNTLSELSDVEQKLQGLSAGGSLAVIELGEAKLEPSQLLAITRRIFEQRKLDFITYNRIFTYCANCRKSWLGSLSKCPSCNTIGKLSVFNRYALL